MKLTLQRLYLPEATLGVLSFAGLAGRLFTLEETWKANGADSCVPEGHYKLERHSTEKHPRTWALVGETVSHQREPGKARAAVLFHAGNDTEDTLGCILPGQTAVIVPRAEVRNSVAAFGQLLAILDGDAEHDLVIQRG